MFLKLKVYLPTDTGQKLLICEAARGVRQHTDFVSLTFTDVNDRNLVRLSTAIVILIL